MKIATQVVGTAPRLGFLGVGWIGAHRLRAVVESGSGTVAAIAEPNAAMRENAQSLAPLAELGSSIDELLAIDDLDGIVVATPSALHATQAIAALERGLAVFCQKPLGRTAVETRHVIDAARTADRLLGVDMCYRYVRGVSELRERICKGELGHVYAADLVFHNAYGPDKSWFRDARLSGGGCLIDIGIHLVDLALWLLGFPRVHRAAGRLFAGGERLRAGADAVEDYVEATLDVEGGGVIRLSCSWNLPAGRNAVIDAGFYGTLGGGGICNIDGSFYDFLVEHYDGTQTTPLAPRLPDPWGGRAINEWVTRLAAGEGYDPAVEELLHTANALDVIYRR